MIKNDISEICKTDQLIAELGEAVVEKAGKKCAKVSSRMRDMARLKKQLNKEIPGKMDDFIDPKHLDTVVKAARELYQFYNDGGHIKSRRPSLGLRLGNNLKKMCTVIKGAGNQTEE